MKKAAAVLVTVLLVFGNVSAQVKADTENLYAQSAILMDADSGRVLFEKNGRQIMPMASTTKIMTCILTLESAPLDEVVTASSAAVSQPKVHLGMRSGEQFYLKDLLYSLMLESHNDTAVAIAEHVGGSVEGFAEKMNAKAKEIGCENTYFITPNGLDAQDEKGVHSTTAEDLGKIMRYCIRTSPRKAEFLEITRTSSHAFSNVAENRSFSCVNHNAFLGMMEGALTGKTGFTSGAGYCYVGALERDGKTFIVALLACGWPNNKNYKWSDTKKLMDYGLENYDYQDVWTVPDLPRIPVEEGIPETNSPSAAAYVNIRLDTGGDTGLSCLLGKEEQVEVRMEVAEKLQAPVEAGKKVGSMSYYLEGECLKSYDIITVDAVGKMDYHWCFYYIMERFLG